MPLDCTPSWISARSGVTLTTAVPLTCTVRSCRRRCWRGWGTWLALGLGAWAFGFGRIEKNRMKTRMPVKTALRNVENCFMGTS